METVSEVSLVLQQLMWWSLKPTGNAVTSIKEYEQLVKNTSNHHGSFYLDDTMNNQIPQEEPHHQGQCHPTMFQKVLKHRDIKYRSVEVSHLYGIENFDSLDVQYVNHY